MISVADWLPEFPPQATSKRQKKDQPGHLFDRRRGTFAAQELSPSHRRTRSPAIRPVPRKLKPGNRQIPLFQPADGTGQIGVFRRFALQHVDHVVVRDDADQVLLVIDDRNRQKVVIGNFGGHRFLIVGRFDRHQVPLHQIGDRHVRPVEVRDQLPGRQRAAQVVFLVDDVDVVNCLEVFGDAAQLFERRAHGERLRQPSHFGRHHGAGGAFRIRLQALNVAALFGRDQRQQSSATTSSSTAFSRSTRSSAGMSAISVLTLSGSHVSMISICFWRSR